MVPGVLYMSTDVHIEVEIDYRQTANTTMFSFMKSSRKKEDECWTASSVLDRLKGLYKLKLNALEKEYNFHTFHSPELDDPDFDAKPMVLLIGQYSTGKTTFIRYLLEQDFPGIHIGPEPTTDKFIVLNYDENEGVIPGNALVVDRKKQFTQMSRFGNAFLARFQCSKVNNDVLKSITIVDTPGILSGEKQRLSRGYDFAEVVKWLSERADRIILLIDAHKLDISDEFRNVIELLTNCDEKIRIVLNKADMVDHQQLMRVYGALMWSLGKVLQTPEVARVYLGSFWDKPLHFDYNRKLFELEKQDLFSDLQGLPRNVALRKLNDFIKRAKLAKVHAYIISHLKKQMPKMIGKEAKKKELIAKLQDTYTAIQREYQIAAGDFPDLARMQEQLQYHDFTKFKDLNKKLISQVDKMLSDDIAQVMQMIPQEEARIRNEEEPEGPAVHGGAFDEFDSPFGVGACEGINIGRGEQEWVIARDQYKYEDIFNSLNPINGKITGAAAKQVMVKSQLPNNALGKVWKLSDIDRDGMLDLDEFSLAMHLIQIKAEGYDIPAELPEHLIPPDKLHFIQRRNNVL